MAVSEECLPKFMDLKRKSKCVYFFWRERGDSPERLAEMLAGIAGISSSCSK